MSVTRVNNEATFIEYKIFPEVCDKIIKQFEVEIEKAKKYFFSAKKLVSNNFEDFFLNFRSYQTPSTSISDIFFVISHSFSEKSV